MNPIHMDEGGRWLGGRVEPGRVQMILGVVVAQQSIDERFGSIYQSGMLRHRMGLAIVVNAPTIRQTIELMDHRP